MENILNPRSRAETGPEALFSGQDVLRGEISWTIDLGLRLLRKDPEEPFSDLRSMVSGGEGPLR